MVLNPDQVLNSVTVITQRYPVVDNCVNLCVSQSVVLGFDFQWNGHIFDGGGGDMWSQVRHDEVQIGEIRLTESTIGIIGLLKSSLVAQSTIQK